MVDVALVGGQRQLGGIADDDHLTPVDGLAALALEGAAQLPAAGHEIERARHVG